METATLHEVVAPDVNRFTGAEADRTSHRRTTNVFVVAVSGRLESFPSPAETCAPFVTHTPTFKPQQGHDSAVVNTVARQCYDLPDQSMLAIRNDPTMTQGTHIGRNVRHVSFLA